MMAKRGSTQIVRRMSMETFMVRIYTGALSQEQDFVSVEAEKVTTAEDVVKVAARKLNLPDPEKYELAEVFSTAGQLCKERRLDGSDNPVRVQLLWPRVMNAEIDRGLGLYTGYRFYLRKKNLENSNRTSLWMEYSEPNPVDNFLTAFLKQPTSNKEYQDLCNLPDLNERTLLENIKYRFKNSTIYTYVGSILIAVNPFKFFPIYNPKYVKMYQNRRLGDLPPHVFAIADAAFHTMLRTKRNQCIVISGESGSGKTESTNLLLHHLTALSHKGLHGSGVEKTILGAGPVLEAFGNAKTVHNNNSSRFGKFIQVNYKENGMVHGAIVEKYLLEKSRIVSQASNERNYHVFYYLLEGADSLEREKLHLGKPEDYFYLRESGCYSLEEVDEANEFSRLKQSMEIVAFSQVTQKRIFGVLSAVLHLGNVVFKKKGDQHHDESVTIQTPETIQIISKLLMVKEKTLVEALTQKKTTVGDETVVMTHRMEHAVATRDAMAKCLYGALFDWIVLKVNQALLAKRHNSEHQGNSIGVLDIFGFEDFRLNSFEQFCINYANEHLQYYFNQHIFKFEQEEYKKEGIQWKNIEFIDNTGCLELFSKKSVGLFSLLDEECNFPGATNETLLSKFHHHHAKGNVYYEAPQKRELAFTVVHYAGKVKYHIKDFREKNSDQIRMDIVANMKSSSLSFVRELMGVDPVAVLRWTIVKTLIKSVFAFIRAGKIYRHRGGPDATVLQRRKQQTDHLPNLDLGSSNFLSPPCLSPSDLTQHHSSRSSMHEYRRRSRLSSSDSGTDEEDLILPGQRLSANLRSPVDPYVSEDEARVMRRATKVLMKNKSFKPKSRPQTMFSDIKTLKAIANRTIYIGGKVNTKAKPPSVGAQFQWSLSRLMSTLNQANPFFIRCIKSNAEKLACRLDDVLVLRQLRYTGMLATVRIRQSGYNYRLLFEEFAHIYKILLPRGLRSSKEDISTFLEGMNMNQDNYQIGKTKVFLREAEKVQLDECLHQAIMKRVIAIQRWVKTKLEHKNYLQLRSSTVIIQKHVRRYLAQRRVETVKDAIVTIQRWYRGCVQRRSYRLVRKSAIRIQAHIRGHLCRKWYRVIEADLRRQRDEREAAKRAAEDMHSSASDEGVLVKDNSADDLEIHTEQYVRRDSEESSGILDDSESDTLSSDVKSRGDFVTSPPRTPTSRGPEIYVESLQSGKDEYLSKPGQSSRVQDLSKVFQPSQSASDDSPTTDSKISPLSPERLALIDENLKKRQTAPEGFHRSADDVSSTSPFKSFVKGAKHLVGRKKKDSQAEDSDDEQEHLPVSRHMSAMGGVQVFPHQMKQPLSPKTSHKDENVLSADDQEDRKGFHKRRHMRKTVKEKEKENKENRPVETQKGWNVAKTSQWQYPEEYVIDEVWELQLLDEFIGRKISELSKDTEKKESQFDIVFKKCLKSFHTELKSTLAVYMQHEGKLDLKYRDLFANFEVTMSNTCKEDKVGSEFPVTLCINAFRGSLDEFRTSVGSKKKDSKFKKKKDRPKREKAKKDVMEYQGHKFSQVQFNIPTFCELCSAIIWIMEKGHVCQICKYACHRKCVYKSSTPCKGAHDINSQRIVGTKVFGVPLESLVSKEEKIPIFMDKLILLIETHGLYTEGIYRKPGAAPKINLLKTALDTGLKDISIDEYPIHVLASTLKMFLRELPEPLLTFELYDEFIQSAEIHDEKQAIQALYSLVERLPKVNHDVLERLMYHLSRVAQHERSNKMSVNGLAVIFAPCLLRTNKVVQAQDMLTQASRQQLCIEKILQEQTNKLRTNLKDISTLESAEQTANERLSVIRVSMRNTKNVVKKPTEGPPSLSEDPENLEEQERVINSHIESIRQEKDNLTTSLPVLEYRHSSDDEMLSNEDLESVDSSEYGMDESSFDTPAKAPNQLTHLTKHRTDAPQRWPPSNVIKQRSLDDLENLKSHPFLSPLTSKNPSLQETTQYASDSSTLNKKVENKDQDKTALLESLDLHTPVRERVFKKVGEHFKKSNVKYTSVLSKKIKDGDRAIPLTPAHITTVSRDSLTLMKPKSYQEALSPKIKRPKSEFYRLPKSKLAEMPTKQSDAIPVCDVKRKLPLREFENKESMSPEQATGFRLSPRPIMSPGHVLEKARFTVYSSPNLSVLDAGSDSDEEIMV